MIIAEIGLSHDGSLGTAHAYIDALANTGVNAIKFQTHIAQAESSSEEQFRVLFSKQDKSRMDYWERTSFKKEEWFGLKSHCNDLNLNFFSTPSCLAAVDLLEKFNVPLYKIASPEIEDLSDAFPYPYATINISGLALSGVTGIFFGDNRLSGTVNSGEVTRTDILPVVVPSGNLGTYFEIVGISGLSTVYSGIGTSARLTGIQPLSGQEGDLITISGQNLVTGVLERNNHNASLESFNHWNVNFGGVTTGFGLVTASGAITGHVPAGVTAGLTYIQLRNNLSSVHRSGIYFDILDRPPTINEVYSS